MKQATPPGRKGSNERIQFHLSGPSVQLDPRIHAVRHDLADVSLAGILFAPHYARAQPMVCQAAGAFVRGRNAADVPAVTQLLHGETFHVLDITGQWAWGFCAHDGYVGYVDRVKLVLPSVAPDYRVIIATAPVFSAPDIKSPIKLTLPRGSMIAGMNEGDFIAAPEGFVHRRHLAALDDRKSCWVDAASDYLGAPYVWGGRGHVGVDCSGLVQVALAACGISAPRDSDMQRDSIGTPLDAAEPLQRGDFLFFPGHVGIMADGENLLHANAFHMATVIEPLVDVIERLSETHAQPVLARRRITP